MHTAPHQLITSVPVPLGVRDPTPPVVVVCGRPDQGALARATRVAGAGHAPLHLVISLPRPASPWAMFLGARPGTATAETLRRAEESAQDLRGRGLHVEVHTTSGRPARLAGGIARTIGGHVIT